MARNRKAPQRKRSRGATQHPALLFVARWSLVALIWLGFIGAGVVLWYAHDLPDTSHLNEITRRPAVTLVTADGQIVATFGDLYGANLSLDELPSYLPKAVMAIEDRRFYSHPGIDARGLARAMIERGEVAGAGLDVFEHEPAVNPKLLRLDSVVLLPHMGSATLEGRIDMGEKVIINIKTFADGHNPPDRVIETMF